MERLESNLKSNRDSLLDGETYFFYDLLTIEDNIKKIRTLFKKIDQVFFSVKSNPSPILLSKLASLGIGFDVSSEKEFQTAYRASSDYSKITVSGPAKTDSFLNTIGNSDTRSVHVDSFEEFAMLKNTKINLSLRWPLESTYSQKVGLPASDLEKIVKASSEKRRLNGIHIYVGRERATADLVKDKLSQIKKFVLAHPNSFIEKPNLYWGAGLPLVHHIEKEFFPEDNFFNTHLECGRALVHNAGIYVTQVLEAKTVNNERLIIINGGLQHLASHFGSPRFGQEDVHVFFVGDQKQKRSKANIYGSLGVTTDLMAKDIDVAEHLKRGDWIGIGPAGAYGYSAGTNQFLGPNCPTEIFFYGKDIQVSKKNSMNYLEAGIYETQNS